MNRRTVSLSILAALGSLPTLTSSAGADDSPQDDRSKATDGSNASGDVESGLQVHYLEIVTSDVAGMCEFYSSVYGTKFGESEAALGGARTGKLGGNGLIGVRKPMHAGEKPVVRPYVLVSDIASAVAAATKGGAEIAVPPMEIPGHGTIAILIRSEIEFGVWQV
ncbi:MAG: hypothetical protein KDB03_06725 [Planctomycetales bacterium]|nr:hypothetical protein [Planctomycetales bacterium]